MREVLIDYLVNAAWQLPLVCAAACGLARAVTLSPGRQAGLWSGALVLGLVLPLRLSILAPGLIAYAAGQPLRQVAIAQTTVPDAASNAIAKLSAAPGLRLDPGIADLLLLAVGLVVLAAALRIFLALVAGGRLARGSQPVTLPAAAAEALARFCARHHLAPPPVRSARIGSPVTVGAARPIILAPASLLHGPVDELRAALLHEAAHIQRGDFGANLAWELLTLPVSWHPALYPLKAGLRQAREAACDALAAGEMASAQLYAECLVGLARKAAAPRLPSVAALAMFGEGPLETRVRALVAVRPRRRLSGVRDGLAAGLALAAVALPAALLHVTPSLAAEPGVARLAATTSPSTQPAPVALPAQAAATAEPGEPARVIVNGHGKHYRHSWATPQGQSLTVYTGSPDEPSPAEQRKIEAQLATAKIDVAKAQAAVARARQQMEGQMTLSREQMEAARRQIAEARAQITGAEMARIQAALALAEARLNDPQIVEEIKKAREVLSSDKVRQQMEKAAEALRDPGRHSLIIENDATDPK